MLTVKHNCVRRTPCAWAHCPLPPPPQTKVAIISVRFIWCADTVDGRTVGHHIPDALSHGNRRPAPPILLHLQPRFIASLPCVFSLPLPSLCTFFYHVDALCSRFATQSLPSPPPSQYNAADADGYMGTSQGFLLFPTNSTFPDGTPFNYTVAHSPWGVDIAGQFVASCRKYGIKPGFYFSLARLATAGWGRLIGIASPIA